MTPAISPWSEEDPFRMPDPRMIDVPRHVRPDVPEQPRRSRRKERAADAADSLIRPFVITGGRTEPVDERLQVQTLVTASPLSSSTQLHFERRQIIEFCQRPLSVAEVASHLGVPIGVARVLIGDLVADNLMVVHHSVGYDFRPSKTLLERILEGVRAL
jgi:Protein of unknown function (DUF742)